MSPGWQATGLCAHIVSSSQPKSKPLGTDAALCVVLILFSNQTWSDWSAITRIMTLLGLIGLSMTLYAVVLFICGFRPADFQTSKISVNPGNG